jgi:hypothetical protein
MVRRLHSLLQNAANTCYNVKCGTGYLPCNQLETRRKTLNEVPEEDFLTDAEPLRLDLGPSEKFFFGPPSNCGPTKNLYTNSERLTQLKSDLGWV